jgi:uncharacterized membrane protein YeaQ/YmgE (transglycosylase-associated protein family)
LRRDDEGQAKRGGPDGIFERLALRGGNQMGWLRRILMGETFRGPILHTSMTKTTHEVEKTGSIYSLLNAFLGAYNRRTDVMERAVKLDERVKRVTHNLDTAGDALRDAVNANQPK